MAVPISQMWTVATYVLKNKLKDFQILGLRAAPKNMRGLTSNRAANDEQLTR